MSYIEQFSGSFVALITPMSETGEVDFDTLSKLVEWHIENGTNGLVILGTTAETVTLSEDEKWAVLTHAIKVNNGRLPIIVGNGSNCTATTIQTTKKYDELSIDGFLTVTPYYNKPNQRGTIAHFRAVAEATDKPIILYNVPGRTNLDLSNDSVVELMKIPNIVGIKDATGDLDRVGIFKQANEEFVLFSGDDATSREFVRLGGHGTISVTANVAPKHIAEMISAALAGDIALAATKDAQIEALHQDLFIEPNPVPAKYALKELGLLPSEFVRLPLVELEPNSKNVIKQALQPIK